jgi:hypothetical protein
VECCTFSEHDAEGRRAYTAGGSKGEEDPDPSWSPSARSAPGASSRQVTWLSRHLGHSSLSVTTEVYGHFERAERKREAAMMEGVFGV